MPIYDIEREWQKLRTALAIADIPRVHETKDHPVELATEVAPRAVEKTFKYWDTTVARYFYGLRISMLKVSGSISPEFSVRMGGGTRGEVWGVSWLPRIELTRNQMLAAMVIDEILSDARNIDNNSIAHTLNKLSVEVEMSLDAILEHLSRARPGNHLSNSDIFRTTISRSSDIRLASDEAQIDEAIKNAG
ncbi:MULTISPECIES: hypothetical protein [unclassified Nocardia]|uniref:hypothetical protein n=1 Tax=unclassified Nocardia TaxID=2637762 RepID=UPI001CE40AED|nr:MULTISPECIES: hypothetical protein [unclassified Nocardia]